MLKTPYFTQKWNFFIRVDTMISCLSLSRVLHISTQKYRKIWYFSQVIWLMLHVLHFFYFDMSHKIHSFSLVISSEAIWIDELDFIVLKLHTYTTLFLLKFISNKKLQVVVRYRFFFCLVFILSNKMPTIDLLIQTYLSTEIHIFFCKIFMNHSTWFNLSHIYSIFVHIYHETECTLKTKIIFFPYS